MRMRSSGKQRLSSLVVQYFWLSSLLSSSFCLLATEIVRQDRLSVIDIASSAIWISGCRILDIANRAPANIRPARRMAYQATELTNALKVVLIGDGKHFLKHTVIVYLQPNKLKG